MPTSDPLKFEIVTLFPDMFDAISNYGVLGRAIRSGALEIGFVNPREFAQDAHRTVDDRPYGGGPGMLMMVQPILEAIQTARQRLLDKGCGSPKVVYVSPQGRLFDQGAAQCFSQQDGLVFLCGRYEGIDERIIELVVDEEWSLGDFVLSGGELPVMAMIDAASRLLPGVLGHQDSAREDSFADGLLDCPHYTRPEQFQGRRVPDVLLSGNHARIRQWRLTQSLGRTWERRPDLLARRTLTQEEKQLLEHYQNEDVSSEQ